MINGQACKTAGKERDGKRIFIVVVKLIVIYLVGHENSLSRCFLGDCFFL